MLMKKSTIGVVCALASTGAIAAGENNVGSCGWGSKVFEGQSGVAPQVLAATTNGTSGNQTFAITSGTSGCTQDGAVTSTWVTALFIEDNKEKLARDMSRGHGETLDALSKLIGITDEHKPAFVRLAKQNFAKIFPSAEVTSKDIVASLKRALESTSELAPYASTLS